MDEDTDGLELEATGFLDLPYVMRRTIINQMNLLTAIQFSQCSEQCFEEARLLILPVRSINICYLHDEAENGVLFQFCRHPDDDEPMYSNFVIYDTQNISESSLRYLHRHSDQYVSIGIDTTEKLMEYVVCLLEGALKLFKNSLKELSINIHNFPYNKMNIGSLPFLEYISLSPNDEIDPVDCGFIDFEQLCALEDMIIIPKLTIDQIFKMNAQAIEVNGSESFDIQQVLDRIFSGECNDSIEYIFLRPTQELQNTPGVFAKRVSESGVDYLFKKMNKMILIVGPRDTPAVQIHADFFGEYKEREWTIL